MTNCKKCWWYGKPIECPANFNIDTKECKNFKPKQNHPTEKGDEKEWRLEDCLLVSDNMEHINLDGFIVLLQKE